MNTSFMPGEVVNGVVLGDARSWVEVLGPDGNLAGSTPTPTPGPSLLTRFAMSFVWIGLCGGLMGVVLGLVGVLAESRPLATAGMPAGVAVGVWLHFGWLRRAKAG